MQQKRVYKILIFTFIITEPSRIKNKRIKGVFHCCQSKYQRNSFADKRQRNPPSSCRHYERHCKHVHQIDLKTIKTRTFPDPDWHICCFLSFLRTNNSNSIQVTQKTYSSSISTMYFWTIQAEYIVTILGWLRFRWMSNSCATSFSSLSSNLTNFTANDFLVSLCKHFLTTANLPLYQQ